LLNPAVLFGATVIAIVLLMGLLAPWLGTIDPTAINPIGAQQGARRGVQRCAPTPASASR